MKINDRIMKVYFTNKVKDINKEIEDIKDTIEEIDDEREKNILYHYISRKIGERNVYEDLLNKLN